LPAASQPVLVIARVNDPDGLAFLGLNYRIDPSGAYTTLAMTNNGAGIFSAVIPGQAAAPSGRSTSKPWTIFRRRVRAHFQMMLRLGSA